MTRDRQGWAGNDPASHFRKGAHMQNQMLSVLPYSDHGPSGKYLIDNLGRSITYLRLAVTNRCNLRCRYCMPKEGVPLSRISDLLSFEEIIRIIKAVASCGISKVRLTGGEPFIRGDFMQLLEVIRGIPGIESVHITSNGVAVAEHVPRLRQLGIAGINLSLDSLDPDRFAFITGRYVLDEVKDTLERLVQAEIAVKVNVVVQDGINTGEIATLAALAETRPITVRFIEQMPFNGCKGPDAAQGWNTGQILTELRRNFPTMHRTLVNSGTARCYIIPGFAGTIGIIGAYSRQFCAGCNKIRITPHGFLKTCLYDNGVLDLRALLRDRSISDDVLAAALAGAVADKPPDGYAAGRFNSGCRESMATIGG
jgi:GTP 3',8-cyclase